MKLTLFEAYDDYGIQLIIFKMIIEHAIDTYGRSKSWLQINGNHIEFSKEVWY